MSKQERMLGMSMGGGTGGGGVLELNEENFVMEMRRLNDMGVGLCTRLHDMIQVMDGRYEDKGTVQKESSGRGRAFSAMPARRRMSGSKRRPSVSLLGNNPLANLSIYSMSAAQYSGGGDTGAPGFRGQPRCLVDESFAKLRKELEKKFPECNVDVNKVLYVVTFRTSIGFVYCEHMYLHLTCYF